MIKSALEKANLKKRVAIISVISNTVLVIGKLIIGLSIHSVSVISEAIHSGMDLVAAIIAFYAVRMAARPADKDHQFGHGKFENVSGTAEAILIFAAAALIIWESSHKIKSPQVISDVGIGVAIMGFSAIVNFFVSRILFKVARETDSVALEADALHLSTDVWTSIGIFLGLIAIHITGISIIDPIAAIVVALFIIKEAYVLTQKSTRDLVDASLSMEDTKIIKEVLEKYKNKVNGYHALRTRKSGSDRYIDLHLVVDGHVHVEDAHALCDDIEADLKARFPSMDILIHVEPCPKSCENCSEICEKSINNPASSYE